MARQVLENGVILPAEYSDDWYDDMTSNLTKLDDVIGSDSEKLSSSDVGAAALSNNYNDLDNLPTIPTVNDATLTIQKNGVDVETFTANASSNVTANITVPTKTSDLTNDSNFLTTSSSLDASKLTGTIDIARLPQGALERVITVANQTARFALTASSVQLGDTVKQLDTGVMYVVVNESKLNSNDGYLEYTAGSASSVPWSGITSKPTEFTPSSHTHTKSEITDFPTNVSTFTNDAGYLTSHQSLSSCVKNVVTNNQTIKSTAITRGTAPSRTQTFGIPFIDNNGTYIGNVYGVFATNMSTFVGLYAYKGTTTSNGDNASVRVGYDASGNAYTYAPTPATTDNSTQIATTAFVRSALSSTSGNIGDIVFACAYYSSITGTTALDLTVSGNALYLAGFDNNTLVVDSSASSLTGTWKFLGTGKPTITSGNGDTKRTGLWKRIA